MRSLRHLPVKPDVITMDVRVAHNQRGVSHQCSVLVEFPFRAHYTERTHTGRRRLCAGSLPSADDYIAIIISLFSYTRIHHVAANVA